MLHKSRDHSSLEFTLHQVIFISTKTTEKKMLNHSVFFFFLKPLSYKWIKKKKIKKNHTQHCYPLSLRRVLPNLCYFYWKQQQEANNRHREYPQHRLPLLRAPSSPHQSPTAFYLPPAPCEKGNRLLISVINSINHYSQHLQDIPPPQCTDALSAD